MPEHKPIQETYTRLNIAMCEHDQGTRPLSCDCPGWRCSAMEVLPGLNLNAGEEATINVTIANYGNMDATGVLMESSYTIFIGNEKESFVPITTQSIDIIPAGSSVVSSYKWTPPDTQSTHGCLHARVFDTYSMLNAEMLATYYDVHIFEWRSKINPQAGWKNVRLIPITNTQSPLVVTYLAKNFSKTSKMTTKTLVTEVNRLTQIRDISEKYPLPFKPAITRSSSGRNHIDGRFAIRQPSGRRIPALRHDSLWPADQINNKFLHKKFGITDFNKLSLPSRLKTQKLGHYFPRKEIKAKDISSLLAKTLDPLEEMRIPVVIPPDQFPKRGRRKVFRIDYQRGLEEPVVHFIYLYH